MATTIALTWPSFNVDCSIVYTYLKANLTSNFDGLYGTPDALNVIFKTDYVDADSAAVSTYWSGITAPMFLPTPTQQVSLAIGEAMSFGTQVLNEFATQNVLGGITQAGLTQSVMDYCHDLTHCLITGSLYNAISEVKIMIADTSSTKAGLSPFITNNVLYVYLNKLQVYLGVTPTPNPGS